MTVSDDVRKPRNAATPTIANALDDVARGVMQGSAQVVPGTRCIGRAITVRETTGSAATSPPPTSRSAI